MNCNCISIIEEKAHADINQRKLFKKDVESVTMEGVGFTIKDGEPETRSFNELKISLVGQKKKENLPIFHTFCPFCGKRCDGTKD